MKECTTQFQRCFNLDKVQLTLKGASDKIAVHPMPKRVLDTLRFSQAECGLISTLLSLRHELWKDHLKICKSVHYDEYKYSSDMDVMVLGTDNEFWFARIIHLCSYTILGIVKRVLAKVRWYTPVSYSFGSIIGTNP